MKRSTGRPRTYASNADRQRAYRQRQELSALGLTRLVEALQAALDRGHSHRLIDHLPDDPQSLCDELASRLADVKLVAHRLNP